MGLFKVAVYGSLREGFGNHRLLAHIDGYEDGVTTEPFTMYSMGGFLAIVPGGDKGAVVEVYEVDEHTFNRLDILEGYPSFYDRKEVEVDLLDGTSTTAWIYYHHEAPTNNLVEDNDWSLYNI